MESILNKLESNLEFKLGEEQRNALLSIFQFIKNGDTIEAALVGSAGTGKTSLTKLIIDYLELNETPYVIAAPTHKAKRVISEVVERSVTTVHQLLLLRPTIDILELDFKDLKFNTSNTDDGIPRKGVLIVDEASMINEVLFDFIVEKCKEKESKVLFIGDAAQLQPIKDNKLSKFVKIDNVFKLTTIYRQKEDNPILNILTDLRTKYKRFFPEIRSESGNLIKYTHWQTLLKDTIDLFKDAVDTEDPNKVKLLAYTNKRVEAFNKVIRKLIFNNDLEYNVGDILMAYDSCEIENYSNNSIWKKSKMKLYNSNDYIIKSVVETSQQIYGILTKGYILELYSVYEELSFNAFILSLDNETKVFEYLALSLENLRISAIQCKNKQEKNKLWVEYFKLNSKFLTPIDLVYNNRVVKSKSIGYGYCLTTHRSQGSSFDTVLIDLDNILTCNNAAELRQLQYVALSRTRKDIHMLTK